MKNAKSSRRQFIKLGAAALTMIPVLAFSARANAATNAGLRAGLKYQAKPEGDKNCTNCTQFVPGASAKDLGTCKILPGDTEISPQGYCIGWVKKT